MRKDRRRTESVAVDARRTETWTAASRFNAVRIGVRVAACIATGVAMNVAIAWLLASFGPARPINGNFSGQGITWLASVSRGRPDYHAEAWGIGIR